jgi:hypothetical protein
VVDRCRLHDHRRLGPAQRVGLLLDPRHAGVVVKDLARPGQDRRRICLWLCQRPDSISYSIGSFPGGFGRQTASLGRSLNTLLM